MIRMFRRVIRASTNNPSKTRNAFWLGKADLIDWIQRPQVGVAEDVNGIERWYPDGTLNTCYNTIDRHVENGRGIRSLSTMTHPSLRQRERSPTLS